MEQNAKSALVLINPAAGLGTAEDYSSDIISKLKDADLLVVEGTLYPLLTRMKNGGLLKYEWQESTQGPPRKYYALTDLGGQLLLELDKAWGEIANTVSLLKQM